MVSADQALQKLLEGNQRFVQEKLAGDHRGQKHRDELLKEQHPFAVIVCCSDSRVPPEIVFDQGIGDLFVVRNAGEVVDDFSLGSIEYAVAKLKVELIFVLGHDDCGAIKAAVSGGEVCGHLAAIVKAIEPAVVKARKEHGDLTANAIGQNVDLVINKIAAAEPVLKNAVATESIKVLGGIYHLKTGKVELRESCHR